MASKAFKYTALALKVLEKILGSKFSVQGIENLPNQPILFVSNHFTRFETFVVPYIIYKNTGRQVRCLADSSLFHGMLGKFLNSVGAVSTKDSKRDGMILKDLLRAEYDWMIYPEGSMIKSKETRKESGFINYTPGRVGPVRTGSAVMALKSQLYRDDMNEAYVDHNTKLLHRLEKEADLEYDPSFFGINTFIVPLSISYYPIRPGDNKIKKMALRVMKKIPSKISEELEIEGNLLLESEMNLHFGQPMNLFEYVKSVRGLVYQVPLIKSETKTNFILKYFKYRLTNDFMDKIYSNLQINFDHIFSAAIHHIPQQEIDIDHLKRVIYLTAIKIDQRKYRIHQSIVEHNLFKIFIDEAHKEFDSVFELAKSQNLITEIAGHKIRINKDILNKKYDFHEIRRENTLQVIANEFFLLDDLNNIVAKICKISDVQLRHKVFEEICERDFQIFDNDYKKFFDQKFSKDKKVGSPFFLSSNPKSCAKAKKVGVLVCHGYKSAPQEVFELGKFINDFGFKVYGVRLKGHGTAPVNMKHVTWQDWYDSMQRGYAALKNCCSEVVIIGFSTGGLLALLSAAHKKNVTGIVAINSALKLLDLRTMLVPGINMWNELLDKLNISKSKMEYVDDYPENPHINYNRNYLKGVEQLEKLMKECDNNLQNISAPSLIIQAKKDPVVNPVSGKIIFNKISSENKILLEPDFSNHCIVNGENREEIFDMIKKFFCQLNLL